MAYLTPNAPPENRFTYRMLRIPNQPEVIALINGALASLLFESNWEAFGDMTPEETAQMMKRIYLDYTGLYMPQIGSIIHSVVADPSPNWLPCNGTIYNQADYPELMEVLDPFFKHTPTQFFTPHLAGRVMIGVGATFGGGSTYAAYDFGGQESHTLTELEMPAHSHSIFASLGTVLVVAPGEALVTLADVVPSSVGVTGGGLAHENRQPYAAVPTYIVAR